MRTDTQMPTFDVKPDVTRTKNIYNTNLSYVQVKLLDLDAECQIDLMSGKGIRLIEVESFNKKNEKLYHGLQSEFFGSDFSEEDAFRERYSCKCGKYIGKVYDGYECEVCGATVQYSDIDLTKFGWIILNHFTIISPIFAAKLSDLLGSYDGDKYLNKILETTYDEDTGEIKYTDKELLDLKKFPYIHKGMQWLSLNLMEILDLYEKKKPSKLNLIRQLKENIHCIFIHSIPVYSSLLRTEMPGEKGGKDFRMKSNTTYRAIIRLVNSINLHDPEDFDQKTLNSIDRRLGAINRELTIIFNDTYRGLTGKGGDLVSRILGGRHNFSARNIIVPSTGLLQTDEIALGYLTFLELFRYEITNLYTKIQGCSYAEANTVVQKGTNHFNSTLYSIMEYMINDKDTRKMCYVLVYRNPCINYGSFVMLRIAMIFKDINHKTLTLSTAVIKSMGADFDGDVVNINRIPTEYLTKKFQKNLNPKYNLHISRVNGLVNSDTMPIKDEIVGFHCFNIL